MVSPAVQTSYPVNNFGKQQRKPCAIFQFHPSEWVIDVGVSGGSKSYMLVSADIGLGSAETSSTTFLRCTPSNFLPMLRRRRFKRLNGGGEAVIASEKPSNPNRIMKTVMDPWTRTNSRRPGVAVSPASET